MSMAFRDLLAQIMDCRGITERDFEKILRENRILTDEMIFAISILIYEYKSADIFFSKMSFTVETKIRFGEHIVEYIFLNKDKKECATVYLNLMNESLYVKYPILNTNLCIGKDLLDYNKDKKSKEMDFRMEILNEQLIRYFIKILPVIYIHIQREWP